MVSCVLSVDVLRFDVYCQIYCPMIVNVYYLWLSHNLYFVMSSVGIAVQILPSVNRRTSAQHANH